MKFTQTETDIIRNALMAYSDLHGEGQADQNILDRLINRFTPAKTNCIHCGAKFAKAFGGAVRYCRHCKIAEVI